MYYLKYYAEIQNFRGQFSRVEIHQAGTRPGQVLIIGDVCGLDLEIQGSQDDVFTPIVKTQAHLSMISSDDKPTEQGIKYGGWGEFFTPDATLYKMLIKTRATEQDPWTTRWTGYITPDSWQEDLGYRTPVTITARDNIGHLQDFEFDFDNYDQYGLASIRSIITAGMNLIELPMTLDMNSAPANFQAAGTNVLDSMVMCRHFEGKDWYSVIESLLDAIGYTLRYTDNNRVTLAPIRYLPNGGRGAGGDNRSNAVPVQFYDGNGVVVPAVKSIIEDHNYDYLGEVEIPIRSSDINYGPEGSYKAYVKWTNTRPGMEGKDAPVYSIVDGGSTNWLPGSDLYKTEDPSLLTLDREGGSWDDYIFLAANGKRYSDAEGKRKQALQFTTRTPNVTLRAKFNSNPLSVLQDIVVPEDPEYEEEIKGAFVLENIGLYTFEFKVKYESNGETIYWDDTAGWVTEEVTNTRTFEPSSMTTDVEIQLESAFGMEGHGVMTFYFENIQYETSGISSLIVACHGVYARLSSFTIEPNAVNLSKNTVKTNSDERYNVILRRNPEVSPLSRDVLFALPENYETGLFYYPSGSNFPEQYPYSGNWSNLNTSATKPLPVIIHQQILAFRGGVLWELSGECAPIDGGILFANQLVRYKDRVYLITSGTIDFLGSGNLSGAVLREYLDYDDIWDDTEDGDWSGDGEYNTVGGETASGSGHSGSSSGNGGSSNNFFELDGNGGVKLKDRYNGLSATGFITAGGGGSTSEEGGADLASVWLSLKTNEDQFANEKIHVAHIPSLPWSIIGSGKPTTIGGYGITDAYTKTQVDNLIGAIDQFHYEIYPSLASITSPAGNVLYLIGPTGTGSDKYEEYVYANSTFTKIGDTTIDLSPYLTIASAQATYQPIISDLATIRSRSDEGHTAYGWGDHSQAGYLLATTAAETYQTIINDLSTIRSRADEGHTAYGWGNHANAGYFAASDFTDANIVSTLGTTPVNRATADASGNTISSTYATASALSTLSGRVSTLEGRTNWDNYFGIDANGDVYVKMKDANNARNFYGYGAVTAGGVGSSSGGGGGSVDLDRVWESLTNNTDKPNVKINTAHIPDLSISKVTGLQTALNGKQDTISDLSTIRSNASLGATAYNALPNYLPLSGGTVSGTLTVRSGRTWIGSNAGDGSQYENYHGIRWGYHSIDHMDFYEDEFNFYANGGGTPVLKANGNTIWHAGNDGTGSGLDADVWHGFAFNTAETANYNNITWNTLLFSVSRDNVSNKPLNDYTYGIRLKQAGEPNVYWADIASALFNDGLYYRRHAYDGYFDWHQIAFTDSYVAGIDSGIDQRNDYISTIVSPNKLKFLFMAGSAIGTVSGHYYDTIVMRSWGDSSGGTDSAIFFDKFGTDVWHTSIPFGSSSSWGTPRKFWDSGNSNLTTVPWSASSLTLAGAISGTTNIDSLLYFDTTNSRVGIGTPSPAEKLDVNGNILCGNYFQFKAGVDSEIGGRWSSSDNGVYSFIRFISIDTPCHTTRDLGIEYHSGRWTSGTESYGVHRFYVTNDALAMTIKNNGNVGINTPDPGYGLDVNTTFHAGYTYLGYAGGCDVHLLRTGVNYIWADNGTDGSIQFMTKNGSYTMFLYGDGVGIGTQALNGYNLNVSGTIHSTTGIFSDGDVTAGGALSVTGATTLSGALTVNNTASISGNTTIGGNATIGGNIYMTAGNSIDLDGGLDIIYYDSSNDTVYFNFDYASHFSSGIYSDSFITGGGVNASSDARLKDNLTAVSAEKAISVLMQLRPMEWVWNEKNAYLEGNIGAGLVAQEVESVLPFAVSRDTEYLSLNYNVFHAYEIAGLQNHEERIKALEKENEELKREIELLKQ